MTISQWLTQATSAFTDAGIGTARLDAEVLLSDTLGQDRSWLHAHADEELSNRVRQHARTKLDKNMARRIAHEPLAYIRGYQEFYGRDFFVSPDTLTPRPETETMIDVLLEELSQESKVKSQEGLQPTSTQDPEAEDQTGLQIVDIGTGSGCIILTAALELPQSSTLNRTPSYVGLDISEPALKIAHQNAQKYGVAIDFRQFDLLSDSLASHINPHASILILANLPYVPDAYEINQSATKEPPIALFGGTDGLDYYRELFTQIQHIHDSNYSSAVVVLVEALTHQHDRLTALAAQHGLQHAQTTGLISKFIVVSHA